MSEELPKETSTARNIEIFEMTQTENQEIPIAKESDKVGLPPGTLIYVDDDGKDDETLREKGMVRAIQYNESGFTEIRIKNIEEIRSLDQTDKMTWINVSGLWDVNAVQTIGEIFQLNPLVLEDILNMEQRTKTEDYETYLLTILKQMWFDSEAKEIKDNQIGIITFEKTVLTFCEEETPLFGTIVERIKTGGRIRKYGADYLTYGLIDIIVDHYFYINDAFDEWLDDAEKRIIKKTEKADIEEINQMRHELSAFKKEVRPIITIAEKFEKSDSKLVRKQTRILFRDIYDHAVRISDSIETDHEILTGIYDLYTTGISNRLNETMRVLTLISTIFIPLTFIAGVYGMNFRNMPELYWEYGYFACLGLMVIIVIAMVLFFKNKKWI
ncbi:magnesium/cobalt transporter CorA [Methanimicrococcus blatticola]|uniref:Magnesium transport protein CorA n=1 Tax=Methanimicrococcus blatticola TaxID=91560 RepID=A0A484F696_9EURY|nr:magnesium/cobalt transporter CorA [Methanimicrococcus blatticola]MBZ3936232.1 magnesium/cobalt transporter CorA [Methanimicrococcus blatticola]MCC2508236.1 magnesium/cobalt transporter CorA [Methanimicrococcus blatticola]TDQ70309.1 magnesium transporter [Methanimicrococcus blatticola]